MNYTSLLEWHTAHKEQALYGRYLTINQLQPLLDRLPDLFVKESLGYSVQNRPIYKVTFGTGEIKILGWSQMHGNESTTTKALFDLFKWFEANKDTEIGQKLLSTFNFTFIPMLNPDGAEAYTRVNANQVDLNRDAQELTQPESLILKQVYTSLDPDYCLNLHGQRTIFGVGEPAQSAVASFLSPSQDALRTVTQSRKEGMAIIAELNEMLQEFIPGQVGRYDDGFNINCVGDTLQQLNIPTILFEAGHFPNDYAREKTRGFMFLSLIRVFESILLLKSEENVSSNPYFAIPENKKCFFDCIIRNINLPEYGVTDMAIQYQETLRDGILYFVPKIAQIADLDSFVGHSEIDFAQEKIEFPENFTLDVGQNLENLQVNSNLPTTFSVKSNNLL